MPPSNPLARLSPAREDLMELVISRVSVESRDLAPLLERLAPLTASREAALRWEGTLTFVFEGWEDDPRELSEIPAVRAWFRALTDAWPYWWHFIEKVGETFGLVLCLLCRGAAVPGALPGLVGWRFADPREVEHQVLALSGGMNALYARLDLPEAHNERLSQEIAELLVCTLEASGSASVSRYPNRTVSDGPAAPRPSS